MLVHLENISLPQHFQVSLVLTLLFTQLHAPPVQALTCQTLYTLKECARDRLVSLILAPRLVRISQHHLCRLDQSPHWCHSSQCPFGTTGLFPSLKPRYYLWEAIIMFYLVQNSELFPSILSHYGDVIVLVRLFLVGGWDREYYCIAQFTI
jgi:hypothetical protein